MTPRELTINDLLSRVTISISFEAACKKIIDDYNLGTIHKIEPLLVGHSELNTRVTTDKGKFVIKFFNKAKEEAVCQLVADSLQLFQSHGILVPNIVKGPQGYLYKLPDTIGNGYLIVMNFFEGNTFNEVMPTLEDKLSITRYLAAINNLTIDVSPAYDPWLLLYLAQEYDKTKHLLTEDENRLVQPIVDQVRKIDFTQFSHGAVHYDLHRDNIQKGPDGKLCIFDMETVGNGYPILDLATYIGLTCLESSKSIKDNKEICQKVLAEYQKVKPLTEEELTYLDLLIKGILAGMIIIPVYLMKTQDDDTQETYKWYELGKKSLEKFKDTILL